VIRTASMMTAMASRANSMLGSTCPVGLEGDPKKGAPCEPAIGSVLRVFQSNRFHQSAFQRSRGTLFEAFMAAPGLLN